MSRVMKDPVASEDCSPQREGEASLLARWWPSLLLAFALGAALPPSAHGQDARPFVIPDGALEVPHQASLSAAQPRATTENMRIVLLRGPTKVHAGQPATYKAMVRRDEGTSSFSYSWAFGEDNASPMGGQRASGPKASRSKPSKPELSMSSTSRLAVRKVGMISSHTARRSRVAATHTYDQPGTYKVTLSTRFRGTRATKSIEVTVTPRDTEGRPVADASQVNASNPNATIATTEASASGPRAGTSSSTYEGGSGDSRGAPRRLLPEITQEPRGWGVVVASLKGASAAKRVAGRYRQQLGDRAGPVRVMESFLEEGRHFRVVLGEFPGRIDAVEMITRNQSRLPRDTWTVPLPRRFFSEIAQAR